MQKTRLLVGLALIALSGSARAQDEGPTATTTADPTMDPADRGAAVGAPALETASAPVSSGDTSYVSRGLTVGAHALQVTLPAVLPLPEGEMLKPVWIPLELRFGLSDRLDVFLSHNYFGLPPAFRGGGLCIGDKERTCPELYDNFNLGMQLSLFKDAGIELSGIGALEFRTLDTVRLAVDLGIGFKYRGGPVAIKAAPQVGIAVNKRVEQTGTFIAVPVQLALQAMSKLAVFLDTGLFGPTQDFSQSYAVPVGIGADFEVMPFLDVGAEFMLPLALSGSGEGIDLERRMLMVYATLRMN